MRITDENRKICQILVILVAGKGSQIEGHAKLVTNEDLYCPYPSARLSKVVLCVGLEYFERKIIDCRTRKSFKNISQAYFGDFIISKTNAKSHTAHDT